jgi:hypothetical protein
MSHLLESELLEPVSAFLRDRGCEFLVPELMFFDRGIDVYGICGGRTKTSYAVELKLTDWRKALKQAAIYQLCSDFCYVALPSRTIACVDPEPFKESGVGLLSVREDNSVTIIFEASKSREKRPFYSKKFRSLIPKGLEYAT